MGRPGRITRRSCVAAAAAVAALLLLSCADSLPEPDIAADADDAALDLAANMPPVPVSYLGRFSPSFYQAVDESAPEFRGRSRTEAVRDRTGEILARVSAPFLRRLNIEGCGRLADGRVVTYDTRVRGTIRYRFTEHAFGVSHCETPLVPYRTVAVDASVIPLGSMIFVPRVRGLLLPDGTTHDGFFRAEDIGSSIRGERIDFFVGFDDHLDNALTRQERLRHGRPVAVYIASGEMEDP